VSGIKKDIRAEVDSCWSTRAYNKYFFKNKLESLGTATRLRGVRPAC